MKKNQFTAHRSEHRRIVLLCLILFMILFSPLLLLNSCSKNKDNKEIKIFYLSDFKNIVINKSSFKDVAKIAPKSRIIVTSFGGVSEYPTIDEKYIRITYEGSDLIVTSIEVTDQRWEDFELST